MNKTMKMMSAAIFAALVLENTVQHITVFAEDDSASDAIEMAGNLFWSNPGISAIRDTVISEYTSLDPSELAILEWELGAGYQLVDYTLQHDIAVENGLTFSGSLGGSYSVTGIIFYVNPSVVNTVGVGFCSVSSSNFSFLSDFGNICIYPVGNDTYSRIINSGGNTNILELDFVNMPVNLDFQGYLSSSGGFDVRNGFGYGRRTNFSFQYSCEWVPGNYSYWGNISSSNPFLSWKSGSDQYGEYDCFNNVGISGLRYCKTGVSMYDESNNPNEFLDLAKQKAISLYGQESVEELWVDIDFSGLPDTGTLDSLTFPPGLPNVAFQDPEIPTDSLPENAVSGASFWFSTFSQMLDALGVKYIVIIFLIIILIMSILKI